MLANVPSFGRNLAYPVPKACMHVLGTRVPRLLGVARSASSPKAAQALGCSLTPGLVWPGHLHGTGFLSARAVGTGFPTVVRRLCLVKLVLTPVAILGSLGVCIYVPASRHRLISYSPIHLT